MLADRARSQSDGECRVDCKDRARTEVLLEAGPQAPRGNVIIDEIGKSGYRRRARAQVSRRSEPVRAQARVHERPCDRHRVMNGVAGCGMAPSGFAPVRLALAP